MSKTRIQLLITDLDNTLYDWYNAFVPAFYAMVEEAARIMSVDDGKLLDDLQVVHRLHANSEHPFALLGAEIVLHTFSGLSKREIQDRLDPAFHVFNRVRKDGLRLYDGVRSGLEQLSLRGVPVVAYTDARIVNSLTRLRKLDIEGLFLKLYAPATVVEPEDRDESAKDEGFVRLLPACDRKPNPRTLADICTEAKVSPERTLYIGDSLVRDVYMARLAGVHSAWARYGTYYDPELWRKLVRVTHWTDGDVAREQDLKERSKGVQADCTLESFDDVFQHYDFQSSADAPA